MSKTKQIAKRLLGGGIPVPGILRPLIRGFYRMSVFTKEGLVLLRKWFFVEPVLRSIADVGSHLRAERLPYIRGKGRLIIGDNVNLSGQSCFYFMNALKDIPTIRIGNNVFIGNGCTFSAGRSINIGSRCLVSAGVRIHDNDGHPADAQARREGCGITFDQTAEVVIEENVWIGACATILKGVKIGQNAIVGTGAVVTHDVAPDTIVAGNPARIVKEMSKSGSDGERHS